MPRLLAGILALCLVLPLASADEKPPKLLPAAAGPIDFDRDIRPILNRACFSCHGGEKEKGGLRLDDAKAALAGGNSGAVIVPGAKAAESRLLALVAGLDPDTKMPPKGDSLTTEEIGKLRAWMEQGAKWGETKSSSANAPVRKSDHWAFQPVKTIAAPTVRDTAWPRNPIDAFVLARLEREKVQPSPEADKPTLLRRLCLDLLGLPPTQEQFDEFMRDESTGAYERLVDRLLASPHYGERWARHWLDAARYADSDGFEKDTGRPWAWRYRDWVINALNADLPFDKFTIEQLAGDLLPNATIEQKIATGFHRNTLTNKEGGVDPEQFRVEATIDRTNTTAKIFLGLTVGCAQCHDHKYDPISQRDYYQLYAFFNSANEADIEAPMPGEEERFRKAKQDYDAKHAELKAKIAEHKLAVPKLQDEWEAGLTLPAVRKLPEPIRAAVLIEPAARNDEQKKQIAAYFAKQDAVGTKLAKSLAALEKKAPVHSQAPTMSAGPARATNILIRGDFLRPGAAVSAITPAVLPPMQATAAPTRLDLAKWIVDPANPLTRRVLANWLWQQHFGKGLVTTSEDFGTQGDRPTHPELLDWLAGEVLHRNWSLKSLHKLIVTSATYRQTSITRLELRERDPLNAWLARQNRLRLEGEIVRDITLSASGLMNPAVGGPSVRPPQPPEISELTYAGSVKWAESKGPDRYRRGLYTWFQRTSPYPMLMTFDAPDSNLCIVRRERSNTPLQALSLMNDVVFVECARALGRKLMALDAADPAAKLADGVRRCLNRPATDAERERLLKLFDTMRELARRDAAESARLAGPNLPAGADPAEAAAWVAVARVLMNLDEFVTRE